MDYTRPESMIWLTVQIQENKNTGFTDRKERR